VKSTELLANAASGKAIASNAIKTIRFITVFLLNLLKPSVVKMKFKASAGQRPTPT
jgi:hypothetical protein